MCVNNLPRVALGMAAWWLGLEPVTWWSQVWLPNHSATEPHSTKGKQARCTGHNGAHAGCSSSHMRLSPSSLDWIIPVTHGQCNARPTSYHPSICRYQITTAQCQETQAWQPLGQGCTRQHGRGDLNQGPVDRKSSTLTLGHRATLHIITK